MIVLDFFANIYLTLMEIIGFFLASWVTLGSLVVPIVIIYLLYKHRRNKDEIIKILKPVIGILLIFVIYYFLTK